MKGRYSIGKLDKPLGVVKKGILSQKEIDKIYKSTNSTKRRNLNMKKKRCNHPKNRIFTNSDKTCGICGRSTMKKNKKYEKLLENT